MVDHGKAGSGEARKFEDPEEQSEHEHFVRWLWHEGYRGLAKKYSKSVGISYKDAVHLNDGESR